MIGGFQQIVISSNEPWGDTWYSKQNYAWELSKHHEVLFLDPPLGWKKTALSGKEISTRKISERLTVLQYANSLPILGKSWFTKNDQRVSRKLAQWLTANGWRDFLYWSFDPYRLAKPKAFGAKRSIFHVVDQYNFVPHGEASLAREADLIICVAEEFRAAYTSLNKHIEVLPHAIASSEFSGGDAAIRARLPQQPFGLYVGNIDERVDFGTVEKILRRFPSTPLVFVGPLIYPKNNAPAIKLFETKSYPNLITTGGKPFRELKHYITEAAFCLAPMNRQHPGNTISHHKLLQYLALGKPVFSCRFSAEDRAEKLLSMHDSDESLLQALAHFLENGEAADLREARIHFAQSHTFDAAFEKIDNWLNKISVT